MFSSEKKRSVFDSKKESIRSRVEEEGRFENQRHQANTLKVNEKSLNHRSHIGFCCTVDRGY
jgi:hypothetical protein